MNFRAGIKTVSKNLNQIDRSLGGRLRDKRMSNGLSQEQLAEKLGIDPKDVDLYETGAKRISADRLLRIAKALGVRPVYFFGFSEDITPGKSKSSERSCEGPGRLSYPCPIRAYGFTEPSSTSKTLSCVRPLSLWWSKWPRARTSTNHLAGTRRRPRGGAKSGVTLAPPSGGGARRQVRRRRVLPPCPAPASTLPAMPSASRNAWRGPSPVSKSPA